MAVDGIVGGSILVSFTVRAASVGAQATYEAFHAAIAAITDGSFAVGDYTAGAMTIPTLGVKQVSPLPE